MAFVFIRLGGFSQGGALALFTYLTMTSCLPSLAGVAAFSTWLPQVDGHENLVSNTVHRALFELLNLCGYGYLLSEALNNHFPHFRLADADAHPAMSRLRRRDRSVSSRATNF